jgi:predicted secreted protein
MTAVEFLVQQICGEHTEAWKEEIQQALEMEEQQHEETFEAGYGDLYTSFEQYYSETYKKDNI